MSQHPPTPTLLCISFQVLPVQCITCIFHGLGHVKWCVCNIYISYRFKLLLSVGTGDCCLSETGCLPSKSGRLTGKDATQYQRSYPVGSQTLLQAETKRQDMLQRLTKHSFWTQSFFYVSQSCFTQISKQL